MRIRTYCIIRKLLKNLLEITQDAELPIDKDWLLYITKNELIEIALISKKKYNLKNLVAMSNAELIAEIAEEAYVIEFLLRKISILLDSDGFLVDKFMVNLILKQLQLPSHYLSAKPLNDLDAYDINNLMALLKKGGKIRDSFGLVSADTCLDKPLSQHQRPKILYDNKPEAIEFQQILINEGIVENGAVIIVKTDFFEDSRSI